MYLCINDAIRISFCNAANIFRILQLYRNQTYEVKRYEFNKYSTA